MAEQYKQQGEMVIMNLSFDRMPWPVQIDRVMTKQKTKGPALIWLANAVTNLLDMIMSLYTQYFIADENRSNKMCILVPSIFE